MTVKLFWHEIKSDSTLSQLKSASRIYLRYDILLEHIDLVLDNKVLWKSNWKKTQRDASRIKAYMTDANFLTLLMIQIDLLSLVSVQTLFYQKTAQI